MVVGNNVHYNYARRQTDIILFEQLVYLYVECKRNASEKRYKLLFYFNRSTIGELS